MFPIASYTLSLGEMNYLEESPALDVPRLDGCVRPGREEDLPLGVGVHRRDRTFVIIEDLEGHENIVKEKGWVLAP